LVCKKEKEKKKKKKNHKAYPHHNKHNSYLREKKPNPTEIPSCPISIHEHHSTVVVRVDDCLLT